MARVIKLGINRPATPPGSPIRSRARSTWPTPSALSRSASRCCPIPKRGAEELRRNAKRRLKAVTIPEQPHKHYAAAKMGLVGLSSVFAIEGARSNIKSNVIAPIARTRLTEGLMASMGDAANVFDPAYIAPLVAYLCSEECEYSHDVFNVGAGRYARIFVGSAPGWKAPAGKPPTVEEIRDNRAKIHATDGFKVPYQAVDA